MAADTLQQFLDALQASRLLGPEQSAELGALQKRCADVRVLARELVKRGWLTPYQANQVARGHGKDLIVGPYVLLEPLGEGGMGQVFKARHPLMKRVVALKLIRADRLQSADALSRFQREIVAAGRLSHPNVVIAHDAVQVGKTICLVMEYVEGTELGKLLKQRGPLPVAEACEYVRQAALGLQHAHEQGLVHRDVKPSNLLLTRAVGSQAGGQVKVLDLGLARLGASGEEESATALTGDAVVMGTPDYMAPEQAGDAHAVDIRADIYSLGCTLYALLAGRAPFAGGQLTQKIAAHLNAEPPPLEGIRPDLPAGLSAVVRRLMAKRPEQRYQTPAEVAAAVAPFCGPVSGAAPTAVLALPAEPAMTSSQDASTVAFAGRTDVGVRPTPTASATVIAARGRKLPRWLLPAGAGGALLLVLLVWLIAGGSRESAPEPQATALELDPDAPTVAVRTFEGHTNQVNCVALSADGRRALSASTDRTVRLWDTGTSKQLHSFKLDKGAWSIALSADGKHALAGEGSWMEAGKWQSAPSYDVVLWDLTTNKETRPFTGYKGDVLSVAFHPNGRQLLANPLGGGLCLAELDGSQAPRRVAPGNDCFGNCLLSADGRLALLADTDHALRLWNADNWEPKGALLKGHAKEIRSVAMSANGRRALTSGWDKTVVLWEVPSGKELGRLEGHKTIVTGLALTPDGRWGATGAGTIPAPDGKGARTADFDHIIRLYNLETGKEVRRFEGHTNGLMSLVFSADGRYLLSGSCDATMRLWRWAK
jgi:tRNA A-37 threonylcarbamoyl transferase component Bud32